MIRILIAEDSPTVALLLRNLLEKNADMEVIDVATNGREVVKKSHDLKPDLITMDIRMPLMDGFEATRIIMSTEPVPIVVISSNVNDSELRTTFRAIEEGAVAVIEKPPGPQHPDYENFCKRLVHMVRAMAEVHVIRRIIKPMTQETVEQIFTSPFELQTDAYELIAIGGSTGAPQALAMIFGNMPPSFPLPIVVTQHISPGFIGGMAKWLQGKSMLDIVVAEDHQSLQSGTVYFAPDERHTTVSRNSAGLIIELKDSPPLKGFRPSVNPLLSSVARVCGKRGIGVMLSGMGEDGCEGMCELYDAKGHTLVQDEDSCVIFGMPGAALACGVIDEIVKLNMISAHLIELARK